MNTLKSLALLPATLVHITRLLLHYAAHTDEMIVLALRRLFPKETNARFPGLTRAKVEQWCFGQAFDLPSDPGLLGLGTGRDKTVLDEHGRSDEMETCSSEIFAREIGILKSDEELAQLSLPIAEHAKYLAVRLMIAIVRKEDRGGAGAGASIHNWLKLVNRMKELPSFQVIINWCVWAYVAEFHALKSKIIKTGFAEEKVVTVERAEKNIRLHFGEARARQWMKLATKAKVEATEVVDRTLGMLVADREKAKPKYWSEVIVHRTDEKRQPYVVKLTMVAIELEEFNYLIPTALRKLRDGMPDIMVIKQPNGHIAIMSEKDDVAFTGETRALRSLEFYKIEGRRPTLTVEQLSVKGEVIDWPKACAYWFLLNKEPANQLMCGAETAPSVPGSQIPFQEILEVIRIVKSGKFHGDYWRKCERGYCAGEECPFWKLHMRRCLEVRRTPAAKVLVR